MMKNIIFVLLIFILSFTICYAADAKLIKKIDTLSVRGTNYYPALTPWGDMWTDKTPDSAFYADMAVAKSLNINTVRTFLFFDTDRGFNKADGTPNASYFKKFDVFLDAAWSSGIRVIPCFENLSRFPEPAWKNFMGAFARRYKNDGRILMWDLINEPGGSIGGPLESKELTDFIRDGMKYLKATDKNHLVTVGLCYEIYQLIQITLPDTSHFHDYGARSDYETLGIKRIGDTVRMMREYTPNIPVLIGEYGWSSKDINNNLKKADTNEYHQLSRYGLCLNGYEVYQTAGALNWCLLDYPNNLWDDSQRYFGVVRFDGSLKPSANLMKSIYSRWKNNTASYVFLDDFNTVLRWKNPINSDMIDQLEDDSWFLQKLISDGTGIMEQTRKINPYAHKFLTVSIVDMSPSAEASLSIETDGKTYEIARIKAAGLYSYDISKIIKLTDTAKDFTFKCSVKGKAGNFVNWERISLSDVAE